MNKKQLEIFKLLSQMAVIFGKEESKQRLEYYSIELSEYDFKTVSAAMRTHAKTKTFFPSLAEIIDAVARIESPQLEATDTAQKLINATYHFGEHRASEAKDYLGNSLWAIVNQWGGWMQLCSFPESQKQTIRAQLRDLITEMNRKDKFKIISVGIPELEQKNKLKELDFSEFKK